MNKEQEFPAGQRPLAVPSDSFDDIQIPFEGDLLGRKDLGAKLTDYVDRLASGAVLALDAPWGEGKTWFARHWAASLKQSGYRVGTIDAFQQDYVEDPFMLIAGEVLDLCAPDEGLSYNLRKKASVVMSAILPVATKAAINIAGRVIGTSDLADEFSDAARDAVARGADTGADVAEAWVKKKLAAHDADKRSLKAFRDSLSEFANKQTKPVVIIIDELDRCRPEFAVSLIERIKHFFDVPNLVFVLVMNREQLERAIKGVYGAETDAAAYLGKFLHLSLRLPKERSTRVGENGHRMKSFVDQALQRYGYVDERKEFSHTLAACGILMDLSLRDIERGCALYQLAGRKWPGLMSYLIALKIKRPHVFAKIRDMNGAGEVLAHCADELREGADRPEFEGMSGLWPATYFLTLAYVLCLHPAWVSEDEKRTA